MGEELENFINYNPVHLDESKCNGCINCMKRCPTEAIRVRGGKAQVLYERCVGCGQCVKVCSSRAKYAECDSIDIIKNYKYKIALPATTVNAQFNNLENVDYVLNGLINMGFDEVFEVGVGAEAVVEATRKLIKEKKTKSTIISTACPAVVKLVSIRFENLIPLMSPFVTPEEAAARMALRRAIKKTGYDREDIGVFVISPCSAKAFDLKTGAAKNYIDGIISFSEIYPRLLAEMNKIKTPLKLSVTGKHGINAGSTGNEARACADIKYLSADGVENVINVLTEIENEKFNNVEFVELNACTAGCVGGCLNIENPHVARTKLRILSTSKDREFSSEITEKDLSSLTRNYDLLPASVYKLSNDRMDAFKKIMKINEIYSKLPKLDCGGCGAPSCRAFAEDLLNGVKMSCRYKKTKELL